MNNPDYSAIHDLPSVSVEHDEVLLEVYERIMQYIRALRRDAGLQMVATHPRHVRLIDEKPWDQVMKKFRPSDRACGIYSTENRKCYVQHAFSCCQPKVYANIQCHTRARCANTIAHELMHKGSRGGFNFSFDLNEGLTQALANDEESYSIIRTAVGTFLEPNFYPEQETMWDDLCGTNPDAAEAILYYYWRADDVKAKKAIRESFGAAVLEALSKKNNTKRTRRLLHKAG